MKAWKRLSLQELYDLLDGTEDRVKEKYLRNLINIKLRRELHHEND